MRQLHLAQQRERATQRAQPRVSGGAASAPPRDSAGRHRNNRDLARGTRDRARLDSDSDDDDTTDVVEPMAPADATPGTVAVGCPPA